MVHKYIIKIIPWVAVYNTYSPCKTLVSVVFVFYEELHVMNIKHVYTHYMHVFAKKDYFSAPSNNFQPQLSYDPIISSGKARTVLHKNVIDFSLKKQYL